MATLENAGVSILEALPVTGKHSHSWQLKGVCSRLEEGIRQGETLYETIEKESVFTPFEYALIKTGEKAGMLDRTFKGLSEWFELLYNLQRTFIQKLIYPLFLIHFAALIIPFPAFFAGGTWTAYLTAAAIILSPLYILLFTVFGLLPFLRKNVKAAALVFDNSVLYIPFLRGVIIRIELLRFCTAFRYAVGAGIDMEETISLSSSTVTNLYIRSRTDRLIDAVDSGEPLHVCMRRIGMFPDMVINMFETGETGGKLEETLGKVTEYYEEDVKVSLNSVVKLGTFAIYFGVVIFIAFNIIKMFTGVYSSLGTM